MNKVTPASTAPLDAARNEGELIADLHADAIRAGAKREDFSFDRASTIGYAEFLGRLEQSQAEAVRREAKKGYDEAIAWQLDDEAHGAAISAFASELRALAELGEDVMREAFLVGVERSRRWGTMPTVQCNEAKVRLKWSHDHVDLYAGSGAVFLVDVKGYVHLSNRSGGRV